MKAAAIFTLCFIQSAFAADPIWLCREESSQRQENAIKACGIGTGKDENAARLNAFDNSKTEFLRICKSSDDCRDHEITIEPKRTSCEQEDGGYKCYRLIVFTIAAAVRGSGLGGAAESDQKVGGRVRSQLTMKDKPDVFQPFVYESIKDNPKVRRGMTKKEFLAAFGAPSSVSDSTSYGEQRTLQMFYRGKMCVYTSCYVIVLGDRVTAYSDFKPIYSEDLK